MIQKMKKLKKDKKGFTLVELIVVLVILGILIALLVPSLTGYIKKADEKVVLAEARSAQMAVQTIASENFDTGSTTDYVWTADDSTAAQKLGEVPGTISAVKITDGLISEMTYANSKYTAEYKKAAGEETPSWKVK